MKEQSGAVVSALARNDLRKRKLIRALFILSFTILPIVSFLLFYVYVNIDAFAMAFQKPENGKIVWAGLENFKWAIERILSGSTVEIDNLQLAFINTFKTFGVQMIMYPIGIANAYFVYKKIWGYKAFRVMFYLPTIVSSVVVSFFFTELMSPSGFFPDLLSKIYKLDYSLYNPLTDSNFANRMVFLNLIWLGFPGNLIIWGGTFSRIPDSLIESARLEGIGWVKELFLIIIPLVWPTFALTLTLSVCGIFGATGQVFLLTGGQYGTQTVSNWMYMHIVQAQNPLAKPLYRISAMGLMLTVVSCILAFTIRKFLASRITEVQY
ncbi:MAG: sugar ABC transporter permease [Clostridia bacterium]|nr:sugar ABC transporter permease [Clostridia bacterium]